VAPRDDEFLEETAVAVSQSIALDERSLQLLVMVAGGVQEFHLPPSGTPFDVGRSASSHIHIDAASVSRNHARIIPDGDAIYIQDLGSTNGTWLNGERLEMEPVPVNVGDAIRFGDVVAQLRGFRASRVFKPRLVTAVEFDERIGEEAERCVRYDRSLAVMAIEIAPVTDRSANTARSAVITNLRSLDVVTVRVPGRFDVMLAECSKEEALEVARRVFDTLQGRGISGRIGVAAYPTDVPSFDSLLLAAQLAMHSVAEEGIEVAKEGARTLQLGDREVIVAEPSMIRLFGLIERVAAGGLPILVFGETGSGKEIIAEAVHALGPRAEKPLVKLNCAAVPEQLLESELFGHEKGAFSGAESAKAGLFEAADGGTLFLDEIGEMNASLQAKLLRVLEDKRVRRVGATKERQVDVRIVAATHRDLKAAATEGRFRRDLFYRLSAMVLKIPPLRERRREVPLLAERFAAEAADQAGLGAVTLTSNTMAALKAYDWPGNIRELRNAISSAVMVCNGKEVKPEHLPPELTKVTTLEAALDSVPSDLTAQVDLGGLPLEEELRAIERRRISEALEACDGNQTQAAKLLGMPRRTLVRKLGSLDIEVGRKRRGR